MKAKISWLSDMKFVGESESGHAVVIDGSRAVGPSPMEMLLLALGACSSIDVVHILEKGREAVDDVQANVEAERAETDPKVFTKIHVHFQVFGDGLNETKIARAVQLSAEKYCSASIMLGKAADVSHSFEIIDG